jgi:hypothetical protein
VGAALELFAVTTRHSGVGQVLSDQCLDHPVTSSGNGRVVKKTPWLMHKTDYYLCCYQGFVDTNTELSCSVMLC